MAFFIATGIISNDVVRKETRNGVLATFRLETGAPRGRKLWIDVECWGHLAGTIAHHGESGRSVNLSGRLTQKTWRDNTTGEARSRIVVTALDADLISGQADALLVPNSVVARGTVDRVLPNRSARSGLVTCLEVSTGRAGTKTGRLVLDVEHWSSRGARSRKPEPGCAIAAFGSLSLRSANSPAGKGPFLVARALS